MFAHEYILNLAICKRELNQELNEPAHVFLFSFLFEFKIDMSPVTNDIK